MSNLVKFSGANLPAVQTLSSALRTLESAAPMQSVILKMDKTGHWVFGADQTEVEPDTTWAVNPFSFIHGFIAWGGEKTPAAGTVLGEKLVPVSEPLPDVGVPPEHATKGWEMQVGFSVKCLDGEDKGLEARYTTTSLGGKRGVQHLAIAIANQVDKDSTRPVPVIKLGKEHYAHKAYGRVYTPIFEIVDWVSMEGDAEAAPQAEAAPAAEAEEGPRRRRRAA